MQCRDPGIRECAHVLDIRLRAIKAVGPSELLRIDSEEPTIAIAAVPARAAFHNMGSLQR